MAWAAALKARLVADGVRLLTKEIEMVHVRYEGRSFDLTEGQLGLQTVTSDQELKERLARRFDVDPESFKPYVVDRTQRGDTIVRPEAVYG
jgi:hypothetical protein